MWMQPSAALPFKPICLTFVGQYTNNPLAASGDPGIPATIKGITGSGTTSVMAGYVVANNENKKVFSSSAHVSVIKQVTAFDVPVDKGVLLYQRPDVGYTTDRYEVKENNRKLRVLGECKNFYYVSIYKAGSSSSFEGGIYEKMFVSKSMFYKTVNGWLKMYHGSTVGGVTHHTVIVPNDDKYQKVWWNFEEKTSAAGFNGWFLDQIREEGVTPVINKGSKGEFTDESGRYWIAVGPNVLDPEYYPWKNQHKDGGNRTFPWPDEFTCSAKIDVVVKDDAENEYYIPCVVSDLKNNTRPNGIYQTGYPFHSGNFEGNPPWDDAIEFIGARLTAGLGDYRLVRINVYWRSL